MSCQCCRIRNRPDFDINVDAFRWKCDLRESGEFFGSDGGGQVMVVERKLIELEL